MNIYFLVEGKRTEKKVYPRWLSILIPELIRVNSHLDIIKNNYYLFSGNGFPSLLDNHLRGCIEDINSVGRYDYFVICLDADEQSIEACQEEILKFIDEKQIFLNSQTKLEIIVQNKCFETWFLGNTKIFKRNPNNDFLKQCVSFYNVKKYDPELMEKPNDFAASVSVFHSTYLKEILLERNVNYSKNTPNEVGEEYFLNQLKDRIQKTNHIQSFGYFIDFCNTIKQAINDSIV